MLWTVFIVLLILKLFELIAVSWWLVFAPIWVPWLIIGVIFLVVFLVKSTKGGL